MSWKPIVVSCVFAVCGFAGCIEGEAPNAPPVANAGPDQPGAEAGAGATIPIPAGSQTALVTLDGSGSYDVDGKVVEYVWLNACPRELPDGGTAPGRAELDPANVVSPQLELPAGTHRFTLWVKDNDGARSSGDTVEVKVGSGGSACGGTCEDRIFEQVPSACKSCMCKDPSCAATAIACDATCWQLVQCVALNCATVAASDQTSCAMTNCSAFLGGAAAAPAVGTCIKANCVAECAGAEAGAALTGSDAAAGG